jgi:hypothetical protein
VRVSYPLPISYRFAFPDYTSAGVTGSRALAVAAGVDPGPFDPSRPVKGWQDKTFATGGFYTVLDPKSPETGYLRQIIMSQAAAAKLNLPGVEVYPAWKPAPCIVSYNTPFGTSSTDIAGLVCSQDEANAILAAWQALYPKYALSMIQGMTGIYNISGYPDDRRVFQVAGIGGPSALPSSPLGLALAAMYQNGVGAPGSWVLVGGSPQWRPAPPITQAPTNAVIEPTPLALQPGETIGYRSGVLPGGSLMVLNTAVQLDQLAAAIKNLTAEYVSLGGALPIA